MVEGAIQQYSLQSYTARTDFFNSASAPFLHYIFWSKKSGGGGGGGGGGGVPEDKR